MINQSHFLSEGTTGSLGIYIYIIIYIFLTILTMLQPTSGHPELSAPLGISRLPGLRQGRGQVEAAIFGLGEVTRLLAEEIRQNHPVELGEIII